MNQGKRESALHDLSWGVGKNLFMATTVVLLSLMFTVANAEENKDVQKRYPLKTRQIVLRDPCVLPHDGVYYMVGTGKHGASQGFYVFESLDLKKWSKPIPAFEATKDFWADRDFWAPELHHYKGKFYLFGTAALAPPVRATQIFISDTPTGPFKPLGKRAQTPQNWQCLDGTLFIDDEGAPWMVFCHEWTQVGDGEMQAIRLTEDLSESKGEPVLLFHASDAPWGKSIRDEKAFITDGPWLHRLKNGTLIMLWSSFTEKGRYAVGVAKSESGKIQGPWLQEEKPLFKAHGGHPMLFRTFEGKLMMSLHQPNSGAPAHPRFLEVVETETGLKLVD